MAGQHINSVGAIEVSIDDIQRIVEMIENDTRRGAMRALAATAEVTRGAQEELVDDSGVLEIVVTLIGRTNVMGRGYLRFSPPDRKRIRHSLISSVSNINAFHENNQ